MKGYISVEIAAKRYIRAIIIARLWPKPLISTRDVIGNKLYDLLQHRVNKYRAEFVSKHYNANIRLYISIHLFRQRGANLNETNVKNFNAFVQSLIKDRMRFLLDFYVPMFGSFEKALAVTRNVMKIEDEDWNSDSIKKDYYRYRIKKNIPLLYNKRA